MKKNKNEAKKIPGSKGRLRLFVENLGDSVIPKKYRKNIIKYLERASINDVPYFAYGVATVIIFFVSAVLDIFLLTMEAFANATLVLPILFLFFLPFIFIILSVIAVFIYRIYLEAKIYYKVRRMEEAFPEFLSELALNLQSGQGLEESLENSTEKEFGYLTEEVQRICKKVRLGMDIELAIKEFTDSFDSDIMEETFDLIVTSWKKGSATSQLVDRVYENLRIIRYLKEKVIASVTSYRIFLSVVTIIIAPAMFAMSYYLIDLIRSMTEQITAVSTNVVFPIPINAVRINDAHFLLFSAIALVIISVCTAMIISIIKTGSIKEGYKQLILFAGGSLLAHQFFMFIFKYFFAMFQAG